MHTLQKKILYDRLIVMGFHHHKFSTFNDGFSSSIVSIRYYKTRARRRICIFFEYLWQRTPSDVDVEAVLSNLFTTQPDSNNPRSNVSHHGIRESLGRMSSGAISFRDLENDLASNPQRGYTVFYTHYVDVSLKLPQSPFLQSAVHGCEAMLSQFPPTALDRLNAFALLCEQCLVEPSLVVFTIWYSVTLMNTDPKRVLVSVRTGLSLVTGFSDRTHH